MTTTTTTSVVGSPLAHITPIGLDELVDRASLQTRVDRKYVLPIREVAALLSEIGSDTQVLEIDGIREFAYESIYFDTPELSSYLLAAHRRRRRFKIRIRTYLDSSLCWLEVKTRGPRGSTVKNRLRYEPDGCCILTKGRRFVDTVLATESVAQSIDTVYLPTLTTRYRRSTLFLPATTSRVTIDTKLTWLDGDGRRLRLPDLAIVETKTGATASCVDRQLWGSGYRPTRISKYATGLAAMRPGLPATPWRRTLRRHFATAGPPVAPDTARLLRAS